MKWRFWETEKKTEKKLVEAPKKLVEAPKKEGGRYEITTFLPDKRRYAISFPEPIDFGGKKKLERIELRYDELRQISSGLSGREELHAGEKYVFDRAKLYEILKGYVVKCIKKRKILSNGKVSLIGKANSIDSVFDEELTEKDLSADSSLSDLKCDDSSVFDKKQN